LNIREKWRDNRSRGEPGEGGYGFTTGWQISSMKRLVISSISLAIPILVLAVVLLVLGRQATPAWSEALDEYLAFENRPPTSTLDVRQTMHAGRPWNFKEAMSASVLKAPYRLENSRAIESTSPRSLVSDTLLYEIAAIPLSYPPQDLWCVLLKYQRKASLTHDREAGYRVVYAALHKDLYTAEWVIHISADDFPSQRLAQTFQAIGCKLEPTELASSVR
jgi:hypothetical protein